MSQSPSHFNNTKTSAGIRKRPVLPIKSATKTSTPSAPSSGLDWASFSTFLNSPTTKSPNMAKSSKQNGVNNFDIDANPNVVVDNKKTKMTNNTTNTRTLSKDTSSLQDTHLDSKNSLQGSTVTDNGQAHMSVVVHQQGGPYQTTTPATTAPPASTFYNDGISWYWVCIIFTSLAGVVVTVLGLREAYRRCARKCGFSSDQRVLCWDSLILWNMVTRAKLANDPSAPQVRPSKPLFELPDLDPALDKQYVLDQYAAGHNYRQKKQLPKLNKQPKDRDFFVTFGDMKPKPKPVADTAVATTAATPPAHEVARISHADMQAMVKAMMPVFTMATQNRFMDVTETPPASAPPHRPVYEERPPATNPSADGNRTVTTNATVHTPPGSPSTNVNAIADMMPGGATHDQTGPQDRRYPPAIISSLS